MHSMASKNQALMRGDDAIHWASRSAHLLSQREVALLRSGTTQPNKCHHVRL